MIVTLATLFPWLAFVVLVSLAPELPRVPGFSVGVASLAGHFVVYGGLAGLIYWLHKDFWSSETRQPLDSASISAGIAAVIGLAIELIQQVYTSGRAFEVEDLAANIAGAVMVAASLLVLEMSGSSLRLLRPGIFATGALLALVGATSYMVWDQTLPYGGDHWHAVYRVTICSELQPSFPANDGEIHTHGGPLIHIHPRTGGIEGEKANLAEFFRAAGGQLTNTQLTMPNGDVFTNGDSCPDGSTGFVSVSRFDSQSLTLIESFTSPADYVPRDLETISIDFGSDPGGDVIEN